MRGEVVSAWFWVLSASLNHIAYRKVADIELRHGSFSRFTLHSTWEDAHQALIARKTLRLDRARRELESATRSMAKAAAMTPPKATP